MLLVGVTAATPGSRAAQWAEYEARVPKSIVQLQPFREETRAAQSLLIDLNPRINEWFLLGIVRDSGEVRYYHLENPAPATQSLTLDPDGALLLRSGAHDLCSVRLPSGAADLERTAHSGLPYAPLCSGQLLLRNSVQGTYTALERITDLLRDHVWGGEKIVGWVREALFTDAFIEHGQPAPIQPAQVEAEGPMAGRVSAGFAAASVIPEHLGIGLGVSALQFGRWYAVPDRAGVFVSAIEPLALDPALLERSDRLNPLDAVESGALDYLVALDLSTLELRFELGTDHPRVGWSERAPEAMRDPKLPGPDGIGSVAPLALTGMVSPELVTRTVASFAGGFKRAHGAFRYGPLSEQNSASHYGFLEHGVIFSKLQPGLATVFATADGHVEMKTWTRADDARLEDLEMARQNGVALIEPDPVSGRPMPGIWVNRWGPGNWSGSSDERLRTLRAGLCLQETAQHRYLIFGYFSTATPSAMARVFAAYECRYAMLLDMNALEHTYFALYTLRNGQIRVEHLIDGMSVVDRKGGGGLAPRFLAFPDDRDFFYLTRRAQTP